MSDSVGPAAPLGDDEGQYGRLAHRTSIALAALALGLLARLWLLLPHRTRTGIVPGKILFGWTNWRGTEEPSPDPVAELVLSSLAGPAFSRARNGKAEDLVAQALRDAPVGLDSYYVPLEQPIGDVPVPFIFRQPARAGKEGATAAMLRLHYRVFRGLLGRQKEEFFAEPVIAYRLSASVCVPPTLGDTPHRISFDRRIEDLAGAASTLGPPVRQPALLVLDTDVDEGALNAARRPGSSGHVAYLKNFVADGPADDPRPENQPDFRDPGTHGTSVTALVQQVAPSARIDVGRVADADGSSEYVDGDFLASGLLAAAFSATTYDVVSVSIDDPRPANDFNQGAHRARHLEMIVDGLHDRGTLVVAATGNDEQARSAGVGYPAKTPLVVSVGATTWQGDPSSFSRQDADHPHVLAPGGELDGAGDPSESLGEFVGQPMVGTSFAAPVVAALIATGAAMPGDSGAAPALERGLGVCQGTPYVEVATTRGLGRENMAA